MTAVSPFWPKDVPRTIVRPTRAVHENLRLTATRQPEAPAITFYGRTLSYGRLAADVERLAGYLVRRLGVSKGERVLLYMQNCPQFVMAYYAVLRAGGAVVPVNAMFRARELQFIASDSGARAIICAEDLLPAVTGLMGTGGLAHAVVVSYTDYAASDAEAGVPIPDAVTAPCQVRSEGAITTWTDVQAAGLEAGPIAIAPDDLCVIPYTSGSTGRPKGCIHTHRTVTASIATYTAWNSSAPETVELVSLPLFHVTAMQGPMNVNIAIGAHIVLMGRWDPRTALTLIARHRITAWRNITTMMVDVLSLPDLDAAALSSLKRIGGGGAAMPAALAEKLHRLTGLTYIEGYGLSETIAASHINPPDRPKPQCLGIPIHDVDARILDPETGRELGPGEVGEIVVAGPQVFLGYWNNREETQAAFVTIDGKRFLRTGDLGYADAEGYFFLVDRLKRMINASGFKVWPAEIEAALYGHPGVKAVCVVSAPDARRGETVKAVIVPKTAGAIEPDALTAWCRERMAAYKVPRVVELREALPQLASGKIDWRKVQEEQSGSG